MNDNEGTIPQQIAHLESMAATMREDLKEARAELLKKPYDDKFAKQIVALQTLLKGIVKKVERLRRPAGAPSSSANRASLQIVPPRRD